LGAGKSGQGGAIEVLESNFVSMMGGSETRPLYINYKGTINKLTDDTRSIKIIISGETEAGSAGEQPA
jgi:hypothetical protein